MLRYIEGSGVFHGLSPMTKLFLFFLFSAASVLSTNVQYLFALLLVLLSAFLLGGLSFREIGGFSKFFVALSLTVILLQGFIYPLGETSVLPFLPIKYEGLMFGLSISFRIFVILFSLSILMLTTKQRDLLGSMGRILPQDIAFSLTTAFRFMPILEEEANAINIAQAARGLRKRRAKRLTAYFPIVVPLLSKALQRARNLAMSAETRGYGMPRKRRKIEMEKKDWLAVFLSAATVVLCFYGFHTF